MPSRAAGFPGWSSEELPPGPRSAPQAPPPTRSQAVAPAARRQFETLDAPGAQRIERRHDPRDFGGAPGVAAGKIRDHDDHGDWFAIATESRRHREFGPGPKQRIRSDDRAAQRRQARERRPASP